MSKELADLQLVSLDVKRVWWHDTEADVLDGNEVYIKTLQEWSSTSRGAFQPTNITETWAGAEGPITLEFEQQGSRFRLLPRFLEDYIDVGILSGINKLIRWTTLRFELVEIDDQTAFVVALHAQEKKHLIGQHHWRFERLHQGK